ncbi:hypothetical protein ALI22I_13805 [Saccharothrix sp. ALI-22-I]|nr:hypothetical protein ALI22I_13805 [Saccharothrix sp. ALI-22-I]
MINDALVLGGDDRCAVSLHSAYIGGQLLGDDMAVANTSDAALTADLLRVDGDVLLRRTVIVGRGHSGTLALPAAHIRGHLMLGASRITNPSGPALYATRLHVGGDLSFRMADVRGTSETGAVNLAAAEAGQLDCDELTVRNPSGPLLDLENVRVRDVMVFPAAVACTTDHTQNLVMDGLVVNELRDIDWRAWLHLITHHTERYRPQPYQQLAALERAAGHDGNARRCSSHSSKTSAAALPTCWADGGCA